MTLFAAAGCGAHGRGLFVSRLSLALLVVLMVWAPAMAQEPTEDDIRRVVADRFPDHMSVVDLRYAVFANAGRGGTGRVSAAGTLVTDVPLYEQDYDILRETLVAKGLSSGNVSHYARRRDDPRFSRIFVEVYPVGSRVAFEIEMIYSLGVNGASFNLGSPKVNYDFLRADPPSELPDGAVVAGSSQFDALVDKVVALKASVEKRLHDERIRLEQTLIGKGFIVYGVKSVYDDPLVYEPVLEIEVCDCGNHWQTDYQNADSRLLIEMPVTVRVLKDRTGSYRYDRYRAGETVEMYLWLDVSFSDARRTGFEHQLRLGPAQQYNNPMFRLENVNGVFGNWHRKGPFQYLEEVSSEPRGDDKADTEEDSEAPQVDAAAFIGKWEGVVVPPDGRSFDIVIELDSLEMGTECGRIAHHLRSCSGVLYCQSVKDGILTADQQINKGQDRCMHGRNQLTLTSEDSLSRVWINPTTFVRSSPARLGRVAQ